MKILTALFFILFSASAFGALSPDTPDTRLRYDQVNVQAPLIECQDGNCGKQVLGGPSQYEEAQMRYHLNEVQPPEGWENFTGVVDESGER